MRRKKKRREVFIPKVDIIYKEWTLNIEVLSFLERKLRQTNLDMLNNLSLFPNRTRHVRLRMMTVAVFRICDLTVGREILRFRIVEMVMAMALAAVIRESRRRRRGSEAGLMVAAVMVVVEKMHRWHAMCWRGGTARLRCVRPRVSMFRLFLGRVVPFLQCIGYPIVEYGRPHWSSHLQSRFTIRESHIDNKLRPNNKLHMKQVSINSMPIVFKLKIHKFWHDRVHVDPK